MEVLIAGLVVGSRFLVYMVCKFFKKRMSPWVWLGYTILDILMAVPILLLVLFVSFIDAITNDFNLGIDVWGIVGIYFSIVIFSLVMTFKSFKDHRLEKEKEEERIVAQLLKDKGDQNTKE